MTEGKWAPTPWSADIGECFRIRDSNGGQIAMITFLGKGGRFGPRRDDPEPWHTLHLMTASPDMEEALRYWAASDEEIDEGAKQTMREIAREKRDAALKKARGESGDDQ